MLSRSRGAAPGVLTAAALAVALASPVAQAQQTTGPVKFGAESNDPCQITFTISNATNGWYTLDWVIDDEVPSGTDYGTGHTGRLVNGAPNLPTWGGGVAYSNALDPVITEKTVVLTDIHNLPNPDSDSHDVHYRVILGPQTADRGDGTWNTTSVTGCAPDPEPGSGSLGSLDLGSLGSSTGGGRESFSSDAADTESVGSLLPLELMSTGGAIPQ